jgi:thioredoxin-related protein
MAIFLVIIIYYNNLQQNRIRGADCMINAVRWESDLNIAKSMADVQEKLVMIHFYNPGCGACRQMDSVTYPDSQVISLVHTHLIAVKSHVSMEGDLAGRFRVQYTPTVVLIDGNGKEIYRSVGFLPPEEFIPAMLYGVAAFHFKNNRFDEADKLLDDLLNRYPASRVTVEARRLRGSG